MSKPVLGRGLGALLGGGAKSLAPASPPSGAAGAASPPVYTLPGTAESASGPGTLRKVALERIFPSPLQPRKDFTAETLQELAESIRAQGIVQPLIVRASGDRFELIAGERRWRAAKLVGLTEAPIVERVATDRELLELALIENLQRENLNPMEEALGYSQLATQFDLTQEEVAQKVGRGRVAVANALRLLKLVPAVQSLVRAGQISAGHAKVLLGLTDAGLQQSAAERVVREELTVRQLEEVVARWTGPRPAKAVTTAPPERRDPHVIDVENRIRERFATKVALRYAAGRGSVELRFSTDDELNRLLELFGVATD